MKFTPCQLEVAEALAKGLTYRQIGDRLGVTRDTVKGHTFWANIRIPADFLPGMPMQRRVARYYRERLTKAA